MTAHVPETSRVQGRFVPVPSFSAQRRAACNSAQLRCLKPQRGDQVLQMFGLLPIFLLLATTVATAQETDGFYLGINAGATFGHERELQHFSEGSPTRCDPYVYGPGELPPANDPGCTTSVYRLSATSRMPAVGGSPQGLPWGTTSGR